MVSTAPSLRRAVSALFVGSLAMIPFFGCHQTYDANATEQFADDKDAPPKPQAKGERFGEEREPLEIKKVDFDAKRAMQYLNELCAIGTRISGSDGMTKQQELLRKHFEKFGAKVVLQKFDGKQPSQKDAVPMANMIVTWNPDAKRRIMFCGHYDTRPIADQEPRQADWHKTFLSANDGTSTVAFFMELANHMKNVPLKVGVDFVIFDGEEFINDNRRDKFFLGSNYFAGAYVREKPPYEYIAAVLLDLFAGKDASFPIEDNSNFLAGPVVESIWAEAKTQGVKSFLRQRGPEVQDDHLALNRVQIPAIDIIDFSYKHWHKLSDLPENCSGEKMAEVALVLTAWMQRLK